MTQYLLGSWSELRSGTELLLNFGTKSGFRSGSRKGTKIRPFLENRNEIRSFSFRIFRSGSFRKGLNIYIRTKYFLITIFWNYNFQNTIRSQIYLFVDKSTKSIKHFASNLKRCLKLWRYLIWLCTMCSIAFEILKNDYFLLKIWQKCAARRKNLCAK